MPKDYSMGPFFRRIDTGVMGARPTSRTKDGRRDHKQPRDEVLCFSPHAGISERNGATIMAESSKQFRLT
jgi:hypothetical protein